MKVSDSSFGGGGGGSGGGDVEDELFRDPKSWPPGFRFHPTDEELVLYYLKRKICRRRLKLNVIADVDVYKLDPEELPGHSLLKSGDRQWYFFSPRDRKYPNGVRSNRATRHGYWKATGKDRQIEWNSRSVGSKKTLVFYRGRAPRGERTDWVMHEYTLDEEELKRCKSAQDSYALYKAYKKSGPGPKNGEQYGAPFQEEEWADDSDLFEHDQSNQDNLLQHLDNNVCVDRSLVDNQFQPQIDSAKEILLIEDAPKRNKSQETEYAYEAPKVAADKEIHNDNTIMGPSLDEAVLTEPSIVLHPSWIQSDAQYSFEPTQSATSYLLSHEAPEVTSAPNIYQQPSFEAEEDNFLELDDLIGPQPTFSNTKNSNINLTVEEPYGLNDSDLYFDASMFLREMEPIDQGTTSQPYFEGGIAGLFDYQIQSQLDDDFGGSISSQLWMHDQRSMYFASSQSNQVDMASPNPGMIHSGYQVPPVGMIQSGGLVNLHTEEKQNQENNGNDEASRISAAISNFLGSIPTRPALASENALINRAFERMSSFGRVRITARDADAAVGVAPAPVARRNVGRNGGFLFLSILGALCAISWLLMIGTTVKVLKTFLGRFISSL